MYPKHIWNLDKFKLKMWDDREIDKVVKGFLRQLLGINKKSTINGMRAETGKFPLSLNVYVQMIKYWVRMLTSESSLIQGAHMDNIERFTEGKQCWIRPVVYLLKTCGMDQIDIKEICGKEGAFIKQIRDKLTELYKEQWKKEVEKEDGKLRFYYELKKTLTKSQELIENIPPD